MKQTTGAQAVHRAARLLKAFTPEHPERGLAELAEAVDLHRSTVHRLLAALEREGLVERGGDARGYRLGSEMRALGAQALGAADLRALARPGLEEVVRRTGETASLEVLAGADVLVLEEVTGAHVVGSRSSVGARWPAHATSTGKVLLAHLPPAATREMLARPLPAVTARTLVDGASLRNELAKVRARGWATSVEELEVGYVAVAAPVRGAAGEVVAAICVGGPRDRIGPEDAEGYSPIVITTADEISSRLGYRTKAERTGGQKEDP